MRRRTRHSRGTGIVSLQRQHTPEWIEVEERIRPMQPSQHNLTPVIGAEVRPIKTGACSGFTLEERRFYFALK